MKTKRNTIIMVLAIAKVCNFAIGQVIATTNLALREKEKIARKIDLWCRFIFPAVFALWYVWSLILR
jgi:hypothetical protein